VNKEVTCFLLHWQEACYIFVVNKEVTCFLLHWQEAQQQGLAGSMMAP
jgi:hypothetical protein